MTTADTNKNVRSAISSVRHCADTMETQAANLRQSLPAVPIDEALRKALIELGAGLNDASGRVTFELALLQSELSEDSADIAVMVERLSGMDAVMMGALVAVVDVVEQLENAAECDPEQERAYVLVIEAIGVMLQGLKQAQAATQALAAAEPTAGRR